MLLDKVVSSGCICRLMTNLFNSLCRTVDTCPAVPRVTTNYKKINIYAKSIEIHVFTTWTHHEVT